MKKILIIITALLPMIAFGQVGNDNCNTATAVVIPPSGNTCVTGTTIGAVSDNTTNACDTGTPGNEVWFTFTATGSQNTITVTPSGGPSLQQTVLTVDGTGCADAAYNICNASATNGGAATATWTFAPGTQVWLSVESNNGTQGQFQLCITSITPPAGAGSSCATATTICNTNSFSVTPFPNNNNGFTPNCFLSSLQQPIFYQFTVGQSGTCIWNADPTGAAEYDWAMYNITAGCPGTLVCCNYNYASASGAPVGMATGGAGACGTTGFAGAPGELSPPANVTAGQTYMIIIDNYSNNSVGFNFTWGGTFQIAPVAQFTASPLTACGSANVNITNTSVASTSYSWNFGNGNTSTATNPPSQNYSSPGTYLISLVATSATGCQDVASQSIVINTAPTVNLPANITTCPGSAVAATAFTSNPGGATYTWSNSNTAIGLGASGTGNVPGFTATNATGAAITSTITVTPTLGGCVGTPASYTITVNPRPVANVPANASYCPGAAVPASAYTTTPAGGTFTWTNSNTSIGLGAGGVGNAPGFTATNATGAAITGTITVTPTLNGCTGNTATYTITVNPNPTVNVPANITTCPGSNVAASAFTSNPAGGTFAWTNSNTAIGLVASGAGNTPAFTATNATGAAISGTITVTPTLNGCTGTTNTYTITVNPTPTVNVPANITACPGTNVAASAYTSNPAGATFAWTNSNTSIGLGASGAGNQPAFTATNATGAAITGTITVTPTLAGCAGTPNTYTITINPNPTVTVPANSTVCPGVIVPASNYTSNPAGGTFAWTNSNTTIGLGAGGAGNQPAFTSTNATGAAISGTITVTPTLNGCTGTPSTYTITVNPTPTVNVPANITACPGSNVAASAFTSNPGGGTFAWTNSNTSIGLGASGSGNQPAFTATNGTGAAISGTITVTPTVNGCVGTPNTYTITINPNPVVTQPADIAVCNGVGVPASSYSSTPAGATYTWTNSNTSIGLGAGGAGSTPGFTATNGGGTPISGTTTVTPTLSGCTGPSATYTITVNSQFDATITPAGPFCENAASVNLTAVDAGGTWSGTGITNTSTGTFDPATAGQGTFTITYTIPGACGNTDTENITVNPLPLINAGADVSICAGTNTTLNGSGGGTYSWNNAGTLSNATIANPVATPAATTTYTLTVTLTGCTATDDVIVTVVNNQSAAITPVGPFCESDPSLTLTSVDPGGVWSGNGITNTSTGAFDPNTAGVGTHTITYMISAFCGDTATTTIQILQDMDATITPAGPFCITSNAVNLSAVDAGGTWSGTGITDAVNGTFDPATAGQGTFTITYSIPGQCGDTQTTSITINTQFDATITPVGPFCESAAALTLSAVDPGGTWSGNGITNASTGSFDPNTAGPGTHTITYMISAFCGDTATTTIQILPDMDATITPAGPFCITSNAVNISAVDASGTWSGTGITDAVNGTFDPATAGQGTFTITYSIPGQCGDTQTTSITVNSQFDATITPVGPFCESAAALTLSAVDPGGTWSGNGITNPATGSFNPNTAGPGTHTITYMISAFCGDTATTTIQILPDMDATISPAGPFCDNDPALNLTAVDPGGTWSGTGITDAINGTFDPATAGQGTFTITYSIPGQCGETQTTSITINVDMDATINPAGPFCASNPNTILAAATTGGIWSGPGIINSTTGEFSPTTAGAGNHVITYMLTGSCGDTATVTIQVFADADATISAAGPFCITDPALNLTAAQAGGVWSGTGITNAANGTFDPAIAGAGTHLITYSISGVCGDLDTEEIIVVDLIPSTITAAGPFCVNAAPVNLTAASPGGTWSGTGITNPATGTFNPATAGAGTWTITYTISGSCGTTSTTDITVNPLPVVTFTGDTLSGCVPVNTTFTNTTTGTGSAAWFIDGISVSNSTTTFSNSFNTAGCFDVTLQITSAAGCSNSATQTDMVCASAYPVAEFSFSPVDATVLDPNIDFINESQGASSYVWDFAGLGTSTDINPSFTFPNTDAGNYEVCLEAINAAGCVDSICKVILIYDEFLVYVPNSFTADDDGINDVFSPVVSGHDPLYYEFMVFNRWGELIFESHFNQVGWDGTYKAMAAKQDVYVWKLKVKRLNNGELKEFYGHVTLLR